MIELLTSFSLVQIVIFTFLLLFAIKECVTLYDFFKKKILTLFNKEVSEREMIKKMYKSVETLETEVKDQKERDVLFADKLKFLEEDAKQRKINDEKRREQSIGFQRDFTERLNKQQEILTLLTESDKDDIKGWIVEQFHRYYEEQGWIDDFTMDVLEKRYVHYKTEGGNSYIRELMDKLRSLPHHPQ